METYLTFAIVASAAVWLIARSFRSPASDGCALGCDGCPLALFHGTGSVSCHALLARPRGTTSVADGRQPLRCLSFGVTQVPVARQTTTGGSRTSAAESLTSGAERTTLRASKAIFRLVFPTAVITPSAST